MNVNIPFDMREYKVRAVAHMALHGWELVYGGWGTVGFWNADLGKGVGVVFRETAKDPDGDTIGEVMTLGNKFRAPVRMEDVPNDILEKLHPYTKVPLLGATA